MDRPLVTFAPHHTLPPGPVPIAWESLLSAKLVRVATVNPTSISLVEKPDDDKMKTVTQ